MRYTSIMSSALFALACTPAFATVPSGMPLQTTPFHGARPALHLIASPCPPGKVPTGSTSSANGGCELPADSTNDAAGVAPTVMTACPDGRLPTGSTSSANGGCEVPTGSTPSRTGVKAAPATPCPAGRVPTGSTSGANGGCEAPK